jgi:hypothetical protein
VYSRDFQDYHSPDMWFWVLLDDVEKPRPNLKTAFN